MHLVCMCMCTVMTTDGVGELLRHCVTQTHHLQEELLVHIEALVIIHCNVNSDILVE